MAQSQQALAPRRSIPLSIRLSTWLLAAAILPLLITVGISEWFARPTLTNQARLAMETDAHTRTQLINNYFKDRVLDVQSLAQVPLAQDFLRDPVGNQANAPLIIQNGQVVGSYLDPNYTLWVLFDTQGKPLLSYSTNHTNAKFQPHGKYIIPPEDAQKLLLGKPFISPVYYDPATKKAAVDIYVPSFSMALKRVVGIVRATLRLDYIWSIVNSETGANGNGSDAFILDENNVRIADPTNSKQQFTAIAPLPQDAQQRILNEQRYGSQSTVRVVPDDGLKKALTGPNASTSFTLQPTGHSGSYQVVRQTLSAVPWNYIVLSPINTIITVANQQLIITGVVTLSVIILAALFGLVIGRRISYPILRSVGHLSKNSQSLATLASRQKNAVTEQVWVIDSSQEGLKTVQYYNNAAEVAIQHINTTATRLLDNWDRLDKATLRQAIEQMIETSQYTRRAIHYQNASNEKLATAINIMNQVNEQLVAGSNGADEASHQLQNVVTDLRHVVGG
ncbi:PDC sensor domain-containing protein [Dictyobacter aurantiacus]|uniref:Cache domain-containing protein n=1 Tax=Dictyobacter aurantiacus TaxID=1936993 RepID=A0A401ZJC6_9CHLR|nr:cache domain-containing protein [Dictyobacter aurantiacus]GCE06928.1 hypothetical protein KDAU_42570 [Dictyobacter aurantiacus]